MENKFEQLLRGTLSKEESEQLSEELEKDPFLKKEFEEYRDAWDLVKILERRDLKKKITQLTEQQSKAQSKKWVWYAAASIVILVVCYLGFQQNRSEEQLAQTYFEPYPDKFTSMGQNFNPLSEAMTAYNKENYSEAEHLFNQLPEELSNKVELYRGICLYQINKKEDAKNIFRKLSRDTTSAYQEPALWYLSITHLALNEKDSAITILQTIEQDTLITFHKKDAVDIIEQLH